MQPKLRNWHATALDALIDDATCKLAAASTVGHSVAVMPRHRHSAMSIRILTIKCCIAYTLCIAAPVSAIFLKRRRSTWIAMPMAAER